MAKSFLEVNSFAGGITDNYLGGRNDQAEELKNFNITDKQKLIVRDGSKVNDVNNARVTNNKKIQALVEHEEQVFQVANENVYYNDGTMKVLSGPTGNDTLNQSVDSAEVSTAYWNKHLFITNSEFPSIQKVYDSGSGFVTRNAGLPKPDNGSISHTSGAGSNTYIYAFVWTYKYTIGSVEFLDISTPTYYTVSSATAPTSTTIQLNNLPVLANGVSENWDTTNVKLEIYRTKNNSTVEYLVGEITNGTTTYSDTMGDTALGQGDKLYTNGGIRPNDEPPKAKYLHIVNDVCYYCHVKEGSSVVPNRIRQGVAGDPDSCPSSFYVDLQDDIVGINSINRYPVVFCDDYIYRLEGTYDETGGGGIDAFIIDRSVGCVSSSSIVNAQGMLFWASKTGFYATNGYKTFKISDEFNSRYSKLVETSEQAKRIYGVYDALNRRILWAATSNSTLTENDILFVFDLRWGVRAESVFTTWEGGETFTAPCLLVQGSSVLRGTKEGYLLEHAPGETYDVKVDTTKNPADWHWETVIYDYTSVSFDFGTSAIKKKVTWLSLIAENFTNCVIGIQSHNDDTSDFKDITPITFDSLLEWGDEFVEWGDENLIWNFDGLIEEKRRFPAQGHLRCTYKQIRFTNGYTLIDDQASLGSVTVDTVAKTVTLDNPADKSFSKFSVGYILTHTVDGYAEEFKIVDRTDSVITLEDIDNTLVDFTGQDFKINGYRKGEVLNLLGYVLHYEMRSPSQKTYDGGST